MAFKTYWERTRDTVPSWLSGPLSSAWMQTIGTAADLYAQSVALAQRMGWILDSESPDDALPLFASERRLPRYIHESASTHRERLHGAWVTYSAAGGEDTLIGQLGAAGYPDARIYTSFDWPTHLPLNHWSQFWVYFPVGSHPVTTSGALVGSFTVGDGTVIGPSGLTSAEIKELRALVRQWKPSRWVCRELIFQISGWAVGDGGIVGEPDLLIGGDHAVIGL